MDAHNETSNAGHRWVLLIETQKCLWTSPDAPEVHIAFAEELASYSCEQDALQAIDRYLSAIGALVKWSDVRPIEECARCGADIDTTKQHKVLTMAIEVMAVDAPVTLEAEYPARFCNSCSPDEAAAKITELPNERA